MLGARDRAMICNPEHESLAINKVVETYMDAENVYIDDLFTSSNIYPYMWWFIPVFPVNHASHNVSEPAE